MSGTLYMVATPIGNQADWSARAQETLARVDMVFAEDTRVALRLLRASHIATPVKRYDHHSHDRMWPEAERALKDGDIAYVSDAGTPGVEDPGGRLVEATVAAGFNVSPVPGPSALMAALSVSGFPAERFCVMGFPPKKKGRQTFFDTLAATHGTVVVYEAVHRIEKTVTEIAARQPQRRMVLARELTKTFEQIIRGSATSVLEQLSSSTQKGEYMIVLE